MNNMTIGFYDVNLLNHKNYIGKLIEALVSKKVTVVVFYDEYSEEAAQFLRELGVTFVQNKVITFKTIESLLITNNIDILMTNAQRLGDSAFVSIAKKLGLKTGMIQHGMYIPFMKRERFFFLKKIIKTCRYFIYSLVISKAINEKSIFVFSSFVKTFVKGQVYRKAVPFHKKLNTDFVLVYGEYWKNYHHEIFGYEFNCLHDVGFHELNKLPELLSAEKKVGSICYVAQTLVEDGRLPKTEMLNFLNLLEHSAKKLSLNVIVKLHPRSNKLMYEGRGFKLEFQNIPHCILYIGHYSSLLALTGAVSNQLIYEFLGHPTPEYFAMASKVVKNEQELLDGIANLTSSEYMTTKLNQPFKKVFSDGYSDELVAKKLLREGAR